MAFRSLSSMLGHREKGGGGCTVGVCVALKLLGAQGRWQLSTDKKEKPLTAGALAKVHNRQLALILGSGKCVC